MSSTVVQPDGVIEQKGLGRWKVVIFNNEANSMEEVVDVLMCATGCNIEEAAIEMWEAHTFGKANVHFAQKVECDRAAEVIRTIGVKTEVSREWEEP